MTRYTEKRCIAIDKAYLIYANDFSFYRTTIKNRLFIADSQWKVFRNRTKVRLIGMFFLTNIESSP